jgi:hypothetical protein
MPNPFTQLAPALDVLANEGRILPATGQAVVDLARPDIEEIYDQVSGGDQRVDGLWERPSRTLYRDVHPLGRRERHLFRYFVDGSTKTYFIGTLLEHERSSPVQLAQVGAAGVCRNDEGQLRVVKVRHQVALLLDKSMVSDELWGRLAVVTAGVSNLVLRSTTDADDYSELGAEQRSRGAHKANWLMREAERTIAREDLPGRQADEWLILDGSLGNEYLDWSGAPLIGVAKSFRRDHVFTLGSGPRAQTVNLYSLLAGLHEHQRTAVFPRRKEGRSGLMAFWYVRLRPQRGLDYPLMGVVKVEIPCPEGEPVESDQADLISACLIAERSVTPHGRDSRWHAHLYPVSLAERVIKDSFYTEEVLKAALRWPEHARLTEGAAHER